MFSVLKIEETDVVIQNKTLSINQQREMILEFPLKFTKSNVTGESIEVELRNEEERGSKDEQMKNNFKDELGEIKSMSKAFDVQRLYQLCRTSKEIFIEHVDWKAIATKMRRQGGFKYFDEYSLKRLWIHRCQYGLANIWSDEEDQLLNQLVEQYGYGKWMDISQEDLFQVKIRQFDV